MNLKIKRRFRSEIGLSKSKIEFLSENGNFRAKNDHFRTKNDYLQNENRRVWPKLSNFEL